MNKLLRIILLTLFFITFTSCSMFLNELYPTVETEKENLTVYQITYSDVSYSYSVKYKKNIILSPSEEIIYVGKVSKGKIKPEKELKVGYDDFFWARCNWRGINSYIFDSKEYAYATRKSNLCTVDDFLPISVTVDHIYNYSTHKYIYTYLIQFNSESRPLDLFMLDDNDTEKIAQDDVTEISRLVKINEYTSANTTSFNYEVVTTVTGDHSLWAKLPTGEYVKITNE